MDRLRTLTLLMVLIFPASGTSGDLPALPGSFGQDPVMKMAAPAASWTPENMYEHINGEAELLKRYGARSLINAVYEGGQEDRLSVDLFDMGAAVNAFGLYRLYAGCDGQEYVASGATVLGGDFTSYAWLGAYFMRIDLEAGDGRSAMDSFMAALAAVLPPPDPLPGAVAALQALAARPCAVGYHPEDVDYDLQAGPGYTWAGPDGGTYFLRFLDSPEEAEVHAAVLRNRGAPTVLSWGNAVTWPRVRTEGTSKYLKEVLRKVVKW